MRVASGLGGGHIIGWDMSAALHLGAALGIAPLVLAELLPPVEAMMVRKINERSEDHSNG